ncbi:MAG: hypothetical protein QXY99_02115 [Thermoproteota archaeon]
MLTEGNIQFEVRSEYKLEVKTYSASPFSITLAAPCIVFSTSKSQKKQMAFVKMAGIITFSDAKETKEVSCLFLFGNDSGWICSGTATGERMPLIQLLRKLNLPDPILADKTISAVLNHHINTSEPAITIELPEEILSPRLSHEGERFTPLRSYLNREGEKSTPNSGGKDEHTRSSSYYTTS